MIRSTRGRPLLGEGEDEDEDGDGDEDGDAGGDEDAEARDSLQSAAPASRSTA